MLFGYPAEAIAENWFHECLLGMLQTIQNNLRNGEPSPHWPDIVPEPYRDTLRRRTGIRDRLDAYRTVAAELTHEQLDQVSNSLNEQNEIERLLSGVCNCATLDDFPEPIRQPVKDLFELGFGLLTELGIRDRQYDAIYYSSPIHVCPFCGCEYFDAPGAPREALDHYLAKSKYPFAAANLRNLVPMGNKCNSRYKLAQDILFNEDGTRRRSFYPYNQNHANIQISLERSDPFAGAPGLFPLPLWQIDFEPDSEEVATWDIVFHIRERYQRDILDAEFLSWLREYSSWCRSANIRPISVQNVIDALIRYSTYLEAMSMRDRAFLKSAVFRMLLHHYEQGNQRVIDLINGVVIGDMA